MALLISIPFIINCLYLKGVRLASPNTSFSASDMLGLFGSLLTFFGTIALGALALWQNHNLYNNEEKSEAKRIAISNYPLFNFEKTEYVYLNDIETNEKRGISSDELPERGFNGNKMIWKPPYSNEEFLKLTFTIRNIGTTLATNVSVCDEFGEYVENSNVLCIDSDEKENNCKHILPKDSGLLILCIRVKELDEKGPLLYKLTFQNPFSSTYYQNIEAKMEHGKMILIETQMTMDIKE